MVVTFGSNGIALTSMKCIYCKFKLTNQSNSITQRFLQQRANRSGVCAKSGSSQRQHSGVVLFAKHQAQRAQRHAHLGQHPATVAGRRPGTHRRGRRCQQQNYRRLATKRRCDRRRFGQRW